MEGVSNPHLHIAAGPVLEADQARVWPLGIMSFPAASVMLPPGSSQGLWTCVSHPLELPDRHRQGGVRWDFRDEIHAVGLGSVSIPAFQFWKRICAKSYIGGRVGGVVGTKYTGSHLLPGARQRMDAGH